MFLTFFFEKEYIFGFGLIMIPSPPLAIGGSYYWIRESSL
jgi:hypothetical protein